ncbi:competence type IV pilus minor pilin ComGD [Streptococcus ovuberis]|uniref:Competence protein n=1 Tax=Streptococcus ovuberis TaxID=1936207 RepID=A0A7X6S1R0_9STRE|nr:competence type IV pilus minor pilin ComGD [Streptococcus ovuberis]NKZ21062.1 competence protein [Streptococcus ovuberis]
MLKIRIRPQRLPLNRLFVRGFTLLEGLLVLTLVTGLVMSLSGQVKPIFSQVRQELFFLEFEHLYKESQRLSQSKGQKISVTINQDTISNGLQEVDLPPDLQVSPQVIEFDRDGGNHSLSKVVFQTDQKQVSYQLYLGSGKYKKTRD